MRKVKILAIVGSFRKESFNLKLALATKDLLKERADFDLLDYHDVPMYNGDIEFPAPEPVVRVREAVKSADAVWFFTPEYNHSYPGVLKNLIDWLSRRADDDENSVLDGKPAAVSGITPSFAGTVVAQDLLIMLLNFLNMEVMNEPRVTVPNAFKLLDGDKLDLTGSMEFIEGQANNFIGFVRKRIS
jgi:chromate reductase